MVLGELKLPGFIFLSTNGDIVLSSREARDYLYLGDPENVIGRKLYSLVGKDPKTFEVFTKTIVGDDVQREINILTKQGNNITFSGQPAFGMNSIIGWDLLINYSQEISTPVSRSISHIATLALYSKQEYYRLTANSGGQQSRKDREQRDMQRFFIQRTTAIFLLLSRVAGLRIARRLEKALSERSEKKGYGVQMKHGELNLTAPDQPTIGAIHDLLTGAYRYSKNVMSKAMVESESDMLNGELSSDILLTAKKWGIPIR